MSGDPRRILADALRGRSDEEVLAWVAEVGGPGLVLDKIFEQIPPALRGQGDLYVAFELGHPDGSLGYVIVMEEGVARIERRPGDDDSDDVVLRLSLADFLRIVARDISGTRAFLDGRIDIEGDPMYLLELQKTLGIEVNSRAASVVSRKRPA